MLRITVLARGGLSVYGGHYDAHAHQAIIESRDGETVGVSIIYPSPPLAVSVSASGISNTTPTISGNAVSLTLSAIQDVGRLDVLATVGGEVRLVRIRARAKTLVDRYDCAADGV